MHVQWTQSVVAADVGSEGKEETSESNLSLALMWLARWCVVLSFRRLVSACV